MNDSGSILLATSVLALGGLGLYMFRMTHDETDNKDITDKDITNKEEKNNEDTITDLSSLFSWGSSDDKDNKDENKDLDNETEESEIRPRKKPTTKTQRNRKPTGSSRRRYYQ